MSEQVEDRSGHYRRRLGVHGVFVFVAALILGIPFTGVTNPGVEEAQLVVHRWRVAHMQALTHGILLIAMAAGLRYVFMTASQLRFVSLAVVVGAWSAVIGSTLSAAWGVAGRQWEAPVENQIAFVFFGLGVFGVSVGFLVAGLRGAWDTFRAWWMRPRWRNFARNVSCRPRRIVRPSDREGIAAAIRDARQEGLGVRAAGGAYSWSPMAVTDGVMIDVSRLDRILEVDVQAAGGSITVEAGVRIREMTDAAQAAGLTFESTTVIPWVQVGGAFANGCHGTGVHHRHFTELVSRLELVNAQGEIEVHHRPDPETGSPDAWQTWDALTCSLGTLGILYSLTFDCIPLYNVHARDWHDDMRKVLDGVEELVERNEYAEVFWFPYRERVWVKTWSRVDPAVEPQNPGAWRRWMDLVQWFQNHVFGPVMMNLSAVLPFLNPLVSWLSFHMVGRDDRVIPQPMALQYQTSFMKCVDMGYAIPVDEGYDSVRRAWYAVVERLNALRDERIYPQTLVLHLRFVGPGRGLLAPSGRSHRTCYIEVLTFHNTPRYEAYFEAVERDWLALGGRPHWGKLCFVPERIADLYGEDRKRFEEVRERLDPDGVFLNDWVRRILAI